MPRVSKGTRVNKKHKEQNLPASFKVGFIAELDGRTELARALRTNYDAIVADIGGAADVSHVKGALIERFVWLEGILQSIEHELASGQCSKTEAIGRWIQGVNALSGLAKVLGIERKETVKPWIMPASNDAPGELEDK